MAALCLVLISEFWTLESRDVVGLAYPSWPRLLNEREKDVRRPAYYDAKALFLANKKNFKRDLGLGVKRDCYIP